MMTLSKLKTLARLSGMDVQSYSGRFMLGKQCSSIRGDSAFAIIGGLVRSTEYLHSQKMGIEELASLIESAKSDQMGRGVVVYWPEIVYET